MRVDIHLWISLIILMLVSLLVIVMTVSVIPYLTADIFKKLCVLNFLMIVDWLVIVGAWRHNKRIGVG